jgi:hypothetical protein
MPIANFPYAPEELSAFAVTFGTFIISLKNGQIIHHDPADEEAFKQWLLEHEVRYLALRN